MSNFNIEENHNAILSDEQIYQNNKKVNTEKTAFWKFLMYNTKAEIHINSIFSLLYWVSIMECFLFTIGVALFISAPYAYPIFWTFITHVIRAILGFLLMVRLPASHTVIEELKEFENNTIEEIENNLLLTYKNLIEKNEGRIKPVLTWYFIFTIIDIIVDNIVFFYLTERWSNSEYSVMNMVALLVIVAFFICNGVYFSILGSTTFNFPPHIRKQIRMVLCGYLNGLKEVVMGRMKNAYEKTKSRFGRSDISSGESENQGDIHVEVK